MAGGIVIFDSGEHLSSDDQYVWYACGVCGGNYSAEPDEPDWRYRLIFNSDYKFNRFDENLSDLFKEKTAIEPDPIRGLAMRKTNIMADVVHAELPLDNRRSPGFRRIEPHMTANKFYLLIGQHEIGRY